MSDDEFEQPEIKNADDEPDLSANERKVKAETKSLAQKDEGDAALMTGCYTEAIHHYSAALSHFSDHAIVLSNRALAYMKLENYGLAAQELRACDITDEIYKIYAPVECPDGFEIDNIDGGNENDKNDAKEHENAAESPRCVGGDPSIVAEDGGGLRSFISGVASRINLVNGAIIADHTAAATEDKGRIDSPLLSVTEESGSLEIDINDGGNDNSNNKSNNKDDENAAKSPHCVGDNLSIFTEFEAADEATKGKGGGESKLGSFISGVASKINLDLVGGTVITAAENEGRDDSPLHSLRSEPGDEDNVDVGGCGKSLPKQVNCKTLGRGASPLAFLHKNRDEEEEDNDEEEECNSEAGDTIVWEGSDSQKKDDSPMPATPPRAPPNSPLTSKTEDRGFPLNLRTDDGSLLAEADDDATSSPLCYMTPVKCPGGFEVANYASLERLATGGSPSTPAAQTTEADDDKEGAEDGSPPCCPPRPTDDDEVTAEGAVIVKAPTLLPEDSAATDPPSGQLKSVDSTKTNSPSEQLKFFDSAAIDSPGEKPKSVDAAATESPDKQLKSVVIHICDLTATDSPGEKLKSADAAATDSPREQLKSIVLENLSKGYESVVKATEDAFFPQLQEPPKPSDDEKVQLNMAIRKAQDEAAALSSVLQCKGGEKQIGQTKELPQETAEEQLMEGDIMSVHREKVVVPADASKEKTSADNTEILSVQTEKKEPATAGDNEAERTNPVEKEVIHPKKVQDKATENNIQLEKRAGSKEGPADPNKAEEEAEKKKLISSLTFRRVKWRQRSSKPPKSLNSLEDKEKILPKGEPIQKILSSKKSPSVKKSINGIVSDGKNTTNEETALESKESQEAESIKSSPSAVNTTSIGGLLSDRKKANSEEAAAEDDESQEAESSPSMISTRSSISFTGTNMKTAKKRAGSENEDLQEAEPIKELPSTMRARSISSFASSSSAKKTMKAGTKGGDPQEPEPMEKSPSTVSTRSISSFASGSSSERNNEARSETKESQEAATIKESIADDCGKKANDKLPQEEDPDSDAANEQGARNESLSPQNAQERRKQKFDYFQVVIADDTTDMMVRLPAGIDHTFQDLRREIEDDDLLPFSRFKFTVEAGGMGVHRKQEKKWRVSDYGLTERGDGSYRRPHRVYIKEGEK